MNDVPDPSESVPEPPEQPQPPVQPPPPPVQPPPPPVQQPVGAAPQTVVVQAPPKSGKATAAMVLGICSLATLVFCAWLITGFPSLVLGILAIVFGHQAKGEIEKNPGLAGRGQAQAGFVMGLITVGLSVLFLVVVLIALGGISASS
jgi:hypothetical protein